MIERANVFLVANGLVSPGDKVVAMFGAPVGRDGQHQLDPREGR
jgi:pyruvate kinase